MGTEISLDVGGMSIDWSKNDRGIDHGFLFQSKDRQRIRSSDPVDDGEEDDPEFDMGFSRPLRSIVGRLELLGYTLSTVEREYRRVAAASFDFQRSYFEDTGDEEDRPVEPMSMAEFIAFLATAPIASLDDEYVSSRSDEERMGRFADETLKRRIPNYSLGESDGYSERSYFGSLVGFLHPYSLLRLLAEVPENLDAAVEWQYGPLVSNGWAKLGEFVPDARREQTYLIATEGSSDTHILKRAIAVLCSDVADFFRFIDVSERHPFAGTGSLVKFAEGLAKIDVHNRVVFFLDNDAEGVSAFKKIEALTLSANMRAMTLPPLDEFKAFCTIGPDGERVSDINGGAAAIECYLDLEVRGSPNPVVRWTNFKEDVGRYQGSLQSKERYTKAFLNMIGRKDYSTRKLSKVVDAVVQICTAMAADILASKGTGA